MSNKSCSANNPSFQILFLIRGLFQISENFFFETEIFNPFTRFTFAGRRRLKKFRIIILIFMFRIFFVYFISFISFCGLNAFEVFFLLPDVVITDIISYTRSRPNCFFLDILFTTIETLHHETKRDGRKGWWYTFRRTIEITQCNNNGRDNIDNTVQ